jgi:hypothetical protein
MKEVFANASETPLRAVSSLPPDTPEVALRTAIAGLIGGKDNERHMRTLKERLGQGNGRGTVDVLSALMNSAQGGEIPRETLEKMLTFLPAKQDDKTGFSGNSSFVFPSSSTLTGVAAFVNY